MTSSLRDHQVSRSSFSNGLPFLDQIPSSLCPAPRTFVKDNQHQWLSITGALTVGLVRQCQTIHGRDRTCIPPRLPPEWVTTLFFIIMGIISLTVTCGLLVASHWRREATKYARWIAFTGMILFCMAALIFPIGFYINEVGGQPYKLPNNTVVGSSYVLFVLSIFFTIVGLLFAGKVCLPG
ncbi:modulator of smoothened protein [Pteropus alecto]|uniref:modulator of smoothened protein n=1 Tax=Pteropus alecto TaxID=9402 RepID=UPI00076881A6|nr:modulator of smoothened protein [Pteropus alecto]XP_039696190.1 modulator of smoothened protein isoform X1 [Pteropus giganteus]